MRSFPRRAACARNFLGSCAISQASLSRAKLRANAPALLQRALSAARLTCHVSHSIIGFVVMKPALYLLGASLLCVALCAQEPPSPTPPTAPAQNPAAPAVPGRNT